MPGQPRSRLGGDRDRSGGGGGNAPPGDFHPRHRAQHREEFAQAEIFPAENEPFAPFPQSVGLPPMEPPLFIVGHWRSGTTHLFNILGESPRFQTISPVTTGLPWDFLVLGRLLKSLLEKTIPGARFIHIHRHPREVIRSTRNFYRKLLPWLALQQFSPDGIDDIIFEIYDRMMRKLAADTADLPPDRFLEIPFRHLEADPMPVLESLFYRLEIAGWEESVEPMAAYLRSIRHYRKNQYPPDAEDDRTIHRRAKFAFERWGYPPGD